MLKVAIVTEVILRTVRDTKFMAAIAGKGIRNFKRERRITTNARELHHRKRSTFRQQ